MFPGKEGNLPLDKIFIKSRLDLLTAQVRVRCGWGRVRMGWAC